MKIAESWLREWVDPDLDTDALGHQLTMLGSRKKTPSLDVFFLSSNGSHSRWGMIVPKHRHSIVERNRVKRRLREIGRTRVLPRLREQGMTLDVLVRARREAYLVGFRTLKNELQSVTEDLCSDR